ncbi:MAG: DUF3151 family protein [Nitriliruptorales bacterium]|nr:DUF3151 family protein [Nitriliruptorales bacterium]
MPDLPMADRPEVVLPPAPGDAEGALHAALDEPDDDRRAAVGSVVADHPTYLLGWARLSEHGRDPIERYAFARVGYHRGLDAIRKHGWGGNGYVRWEHQTNRGFLLCLARLRDAAAEIGEVDEVDRIDEFLTDLDPDWSDDNLG